jgi:Sodium/calcium exchanger protein
VGGLLNATFGNLPELIICVVALRLVEMVRASLVGAILANVLLALGVAFLLGGRRGRPARGGPLGSGLIIQQRHPDRGGRAPSPRLAHAVSMRASGVPAGRIGASSIMIGARDSVAWP